MHENKIKKDKKWSCSIPVMPNGWGRVEKNYKRKEKVKGKR